MIDLTVPTWLQEKVALWIDRLQLGEWEIGLRLALVLNDDANVQGLCDQYPDLNEARLTFRADIEDTKEWERTIVHELLHVKHSRIDHFLEGVVFPSLDNVLATITYRQFVESYTHSLAKALVDSHGEHSGIE